MLFGKQRGVNCQGMEYYKIVFGVEDTCELGSSASQCSSGLAFITLTTYGLTRQDAHFTDVRLHCVLRCAVDLGDIVL